MCKKLLISLLVLTAVSLAFGLNESNAAVSMQIGTPNASFSFSDYQPAPPNVYVHNDAGRPYYIERDRRVYMEKKHHGKKYKKEKQHKDHGRGNGYDGRDNEREKHGGHGR